MYRMGQQISLEYRKLIDDNSTLTISSLGMCNFPLVQQYPHHQFATINNALTSNFSRCRRKVPTTRRSQILHGTVPVALRGCRVAVVFGSFFYHTRLLGVELPLRSEANS